MQTPDCLLTLVFPRALEDQIIDFMLTHEAQTSGFICGAVSGHGANAVYASTGEKVRGMAQQMRLTAVIREARVGDRYLLCSDGLSDPVSTETIAETLATGTVEEAADRLVQLALRSGGTDNITVVLVQTFVDPLWVPQSQYASEMRY